MSFCMEQLERRAFNGTFLGTRFRNLNVGFVSGKRDTLLLVGARGIEKN